MVVGKIGRAETSTDPAPINMSETIVTFKPKDQWPAGLTKDDILQRLDSKAAHARCHEYLDAADSEPHRYAVDGNSHAGRREGVRFGPADDREEIRRDRTRPARCAGAVDLYAERITGAPYLEIHINRVAAAAIRHQSSAMFRT